MRIADVVAHPVEAPTSGYAMRTWTISQALARIGELVIVDVHDRAGDDHGPGSVDLGRGAVARSERVATTAVEGWLAAQDLDVVIASETALAPWIVRAPTGTRRIVDCHNVESELSRAHATRGPADERAVRAQRVRTFELLEGSVLPQLDDVWVVSRADADALAARVRGRPIDIVPNVVPAAGPARRFPEPGHGVFFGTLWYEPNQEAVTELLAVSDALARRGQEHRLTVAGTGAPAWLAEALAQHAAVTTPGFVDDLAALIERASCAVLPMTYGGGSMIKLLTALGAGCPVVTTPEGARGIPELVDGENVAIRPLGGPFVDAVADVLADPFAYADMGHVGARLVRDRYSVDVLDARVAELLGTTPPTSRAPEA